MVYSRRCKNFVIGNNIVVDEKNNKLYALCFPNDCSNSYILLRSFDLDSGKNSTNYADTIPFSFNDVNSFCTLYYDSLQSQLYAVTNYNHNNQSNIDIYSLAYPPLKIEDTLQADTERKAYSALTKFFIGLGICMIAGMGCIYFCYRKRRKRKFFSRFSNHYSHRRSPRRNFGRRKLQAPANSSQKIIYSFSGRISSMGQRWNRYHQIIHSHLETVADSHHIIQRE